MINKSTKADRESARLVKSELQNIHMKNFDYKVTKTMEKIRELVAALEANENMTSDQFTNVVSAFKD